MSLAGCPANSRLKPDACESLCSHVQDISNHATKRRKSSVYGHGRNKPVAPYSSAIFSRANLAKSQEIAAEGESAWYETPTSQHGASSPTSGTWTYEQVPKSVCAPRASTRTPPWPERIKLVVRAVSELPKVRRAVGTCAWRKGASLHSTEFDGSIPKMRLPDKADRGSTRCGDSFVSFGGKAPSSSGENALRLNTTTRSPTKIDSKTKPS